MRKRERNNLELSFLSLCALIVWSKLAVVAVELSRIYAHGDLKRTGECCITHLAT